MGSTCRYGIFYRFQAQYIIVGFIFSSGKSQKMKIIAALP